MVQLSTVQSPGLFHATKPPPQLLTLLLCLLPTSVPRLVTGDRGTALEQLPIWGKEGKTSQLQTQIAAEVSTGC